MPDNCVPQKIREDFLKIKNKVIFKKRFYFWFFSFRLLKPY
jgi:hypothetical protein